MNKIKIGIIGTGYIGNVHGRIHSRDPRTEVAALYDIIPERAEATAKTIGGKVCSSREELLANCDAVLVCAPNKTHKEIALHAIAEKKHIFCEKPFSIGIAERDQWMACMTQAMSELQIDPTLARRLAESFFGTADWMRNKGV